MKVLSWVLAGVLLVGAGIAGTDMWMQSRLTDDGHDHGGGGNNPYNVGGRQRPPGTTGRPQGDQGGKGGGKGNGKGWNGEQAASGAVGGASVGAAVGTAIFPGIGTAIGGAVGLIGGLLGGGLSGRGKRTKRGKA